MAVHDERSYFCENAYGPAKKFDFSCGEIKNIIRKQPIDYVLEVETPTKARLIHLCEERQIKLRGRKTVGF